jgi:hypothetical protein
MPTNRCSCGWTLDDSPVPIHSTYETRPPGITKEEFGLHLYATIETIGGLLGVEQQRAAAIHQGTGFKIAGLLKRRKELQLVLAKQLPTLNDQEMDDILARYPWVTKC